MKHLLLTTIATVVLGVLIFLIIKKIAESKSYMETLHIKCSKGEYGYEAVQGKMHIHDWLATILHLLGLDHEKLTYRHAGRDFRLTDVHGRVVKDILA